MADPVVPNPLAYCDVCGQRLTLIDMRAEATARGRNYPDRPDSFVIVCEVCNSVDRISDPDLYYRVVEAIRSSQEPPGNGDGNPAGL